MRFPEFLKKNGTIGFVAPSLAVILSLIKRHLIMHLKSFMRWVIRQRLVQIALREVESELAIRQKNVQQS